MSGFLWGVELASAWMIPALVLAIVIWAAYRRVPMYDSFITGAKEGFDVAVMIIPYLAAILVAIKIFMASGLFDDLKGGATWAMRQVGLEEYAETFDLLPLALTRPLSGSGARGVLLTLYDERGPDSVTGMAASLMMGSTETTFYVMALYFGAVKISKVRYALPACLSGDIAGMIASVILAYALYGGAAAKPEEKLPDKAAATQPAKAGNAALGMLDWRSALSPPGLAFSCERFFAAMTYEPKSRLRRNLPGVSMGIS